MPVRYGKIGHGIHLNSRLDFQRILYRVLLLTSDQKWLLQELAGGTGNCVSCGLFVLSR